MPGILNHIGAVYYHLALPFAQRPDESERRKSP